MLPLKAIFQSLDEKYFLFYFTWNFSYIHAKSARISNRSYSVYARSLGPPESHTVKSAFIRVIPLKTIDVSTMYKRKLKILNFSPGSVLAQQREWG